MVRRHLTWAKWLQAQGFTCFCQEAFDGIESIGFREALGPSSRGFRVDLQWLMVYRVHRFGMFGSLLLRLARGLDPEAF